MIETSKSTVVISRSNAQKIIEALPIMLSPDAVVFDIETTGLHKSRDEIVSFAAKSPAAENVVQTLIMPKRPQQLLRKDSEGKCAFDINGIHPDDLVGSPTFEEAYPQIRQTLEYKYWICWNAEFDVEFLDEICDRRNVERIPRVGVRCAMELLSPLAGLRGQRRGGIERLVISEDADDRYRRQKLSSLAKRMGIDTRQAHEAAADVTMTIEIIQWASENLKSLPVPRKAVSSDSSKSQPGRTQEIAEITLIYSREGRNGQYWVLQPDHDVDGEAFLFESQLEQKRFANCKSFIAWLESMPTGCISLPPANILIETRVNSQGYIRVASLQCEADIRRPTWHVNVKRKRKFLSQGWEAGRDWTRDFSEAIALAMEQDGYAYFKD